MVTGIVPEKFAVQCIKDGPDDYILKDCLQWLPAAIKIAPEKRRGENENQKANSQKFLLLDRYEHVTKASSEAIYFAQCLYKC